MSSREQLARLLHKRHDAVVKRVLVLAEASGEDFPVVSSHGLNALRTALRLLEQNVANPADERCFAEVNGLLRDHDDLTGTRARLLVGCYRQVLRKMVSRRFAAEPEMVRQMQAIVNAQARALLARLDAAPAVVVPDAGAAPYELFFDLAGEAMLTFRGGDGHIVQANRQAERLLHRDRDEMRGLPFVELFKPQHRPQARWLVEQAPGRANLRLEEMGAHRGDGQEVPVLLNCTWIGQGAHQIALVIMTDGTRWIQLQRELRDHTGQLEASLLERTQLLAAGEEKYRNLFHQEQSRVRHLALINEVSQCALEQLEKGEESSSGEAPVVRFLHLVVQSLQKQFSGCDAAFYACPEVFDSLQHEDTDHLAGGQDVGAIAVALNAAMARDDQDWEREPGLLVMAHAGGEGLLPPVGTRLTLFGLPADAIEAEGPVWRNEPSPKTQPSGIHRESGSELCVPVVVDGIVAGVFTLSCAACESFTAPDAIALSTVAGIVAGNINAQRVARQARELKDYHASLTDTMLHSLLVTGRDSLVRTVNRRLCQTLGASREALLDRPIERIFGEEAVRLHKLHDVLDDVRLTGEERVISDVQMLIHPEEGGESLAVFELRCFRIFFRGEAQVALLMINMTSRWRRETQLHMLHDMGRLFESSLDVDTVLHTVLTCVTAGSALGFNRAFVFLRDAGSGLFRGAMALGPSSRDEAGRIWHEVTQRHLSLAEMLAGQPRDAEQSQLQRDFSRMNLNLDNPCLPALEQALQQKRALRASQEEMFASPLDIFGATDELADVRRRDYLQARELFTAPETIVVPLLDQQGDVIGLVMADNLYSQTAVSDDSLQLLDTVVCQAALAIGNARAYDALQRAQNDLMAAEKLMVIGEISSRISHEIRNPLATIGGWASSMVKRPGQPEDVQRKAGIIVDEVQRLEGLLTDVLEIAKLRPLLCEPQNVHDVIERAVLLAENDLRASKVVVERDYDSAIPPIMMDRARMLQALLNIIRNGAQAMSGQDGGVLRIVTRISAPPTDVQLARPFVLPYLDISISDQGVGISQAALRQVFDPFFSTKITGSGLGLPVTRRIMQEHEGELEVESELGRGTTFRLRLPMVLQAPQPPDEMEENPSES